MLLREYKALQKIENGYLIHGDTADAMLIFMIFMIVKLLFTKL